MVPRRIIVIGARRRRQGIGPFVAREFAQAGAEVCAVVGSSSETAAEAAAALAADGGIQCRSYGDLERALREEKPDIVAICSPFSVHAEHLRLVAEAECHCLCEKPLLWELENSGTAPASRVDVVRSLVDRFVRAGRHLKILTQWPYTLPGYYSLHPEVGLARVESFSMLLSPIRSGIGAVLDSMPHPLSMIQHLVGCGVIANARADFFDDEGRDLSLCFSYRHEGGSVEANCRFTVAERPPRPAGYAINGKWVRRTIQLPEYSMSLEAEAHGDTVVIEDPLGLLVRDFLRNVEAGAEVEGRRLEEGIAGLEILLGALQSR